MGAEIGNINNGKMIEEELDIDFTDSELVSHVRHALKSVALTSILFASVGVLLTVYLSTTARLQGDNDNYSQLVGLLHYNERLKADEVALLVTSLKAISGAVSYIDNVQHESLLTSVFSMSMWNYGPDVMDAMVDLITSLAASNGKYVDACLDMLVSNFSPPFRFIESLKLPYGKAKKEQVLDRVHFALECITDLIPLAPSRLLPIVMHRIHAIYQRTPEPVILMFVENIFKLESSAIGELVGNKRLISIVIDLLIDFDVQVGWDDILEENPHKGIFDMELEDEQILADIDDDGDDFAREFGGYGRIWKNGVVETLGKLDSIMVLTFEHLNCCKHSGRLVEVHSTLFVTVFESLLESFCQTVMNVYKSKFAQFVIFYACSLDPENCGVRFAEFLAGKFIESSVPPIIRMSAVAYLASYLSRAKFLSAPFVTGMLERLADWCKKYCQQSVSINPEAHKVFYAGCQAIMYVLCFNMRSIMEIPRLKSHLCFLPFREILKSPLEPLKVCLPSIVEEFVRQAKSAHLIDAKSGNPVFHDVLESELSKAFGGKERLDMFFPFDPCLLRKSDSYIRPTFVYWSTVKKAYEDDLDFSSDDDVDVFYPDMNTAESRDVELEGAFEEDDYFDDYHDSLNKMSITPKDSILKKRPNGKCTPLQMPSRLRPSMSPESL
ncbi:hypothetical protein Cgig2_030787 [Carnegiea gigantea]|uniref:RNA polymerase I-specific transcription initiation factor RRN3 n=1 Tax=Carnegiea gigantea TaxID=171969 RepID=A0A9Q1KQF5_9CARY|nr:hypothetical protein Cgig2_030787 [Carnegiea gigantea]